MERRCDLVYFLFAFVRIKREDAAESGQLRRRASGPLHLVEPVLGAAVRQIVTDEPEPEVVRDEVWTRNEKEQA